MKSWLSFERRVEIQNQKIKIQNCLHVLNTLSRISDFLGEFACKCQRFCLIFSNYDFVSLKGCYTNWNWEHWLNTFRPPLKKDIEKGMKIII